MGDADGNETPIISAYGYEGMVQSEEGPITDNNIPGDLYYADCDDGGYCSEVYVGRWSIDNSEELENIINKTILYENSPVNTSIQRALLIGGILDGGEIGPFQGGGHKDEIVGYCENNGYSADGIPSDWLNAFNPYGIVKLYGANLSPQSIFDQFNGQWPCGYGLNIVNVAAHGWCNKDLESITSDMVTDYNFLNDGIESGFPICYSWACYSGSFDNRSDDPNYYYYDDCISERFMSIETGTVAYIANSRYGWFENMSTNGPSQHFDREFFDAVFNENLSIIGQAFTDQKDDVLPLVSENQALDWCYHEINLFSDPTLDIWTDIPSNIVATYPESVNSDVRSIDFHIDSPSNERIALLQNGKLISRSIVDQAGNATLEITDYLDCECSIEVSIIGHNKNRHIGEILVIPVYIKISGRTLTENEPVGNVEVSFFQESSIETYITADDGYYEFNPCYGEGGATKAISLENPTWYFKPEKRIYNNIESPQTEQDFVRYWIKSTSANFNNSTEIDVAEVQLNDYDSQKEQICINDIFPNPTSDYLNVTYSLPVTQEEYILVIKDISDKIIFSQKIPADSDAIIIETKFLMKGVYLLYIRSNHIRSVYKKLILM